MTNPAHGQPMPPYQPVPPIAGAVAKPRNRAAAVALILALLAWLVAALGIGLIVASHALTNGCLADKPLLDAGTLCFVPSGLLSVAAGVTGLISLVRRPAHGAYLSMGVTAMVMGAVGAMVCLVLFGAEITPLARNPAYPPLHPC
jgi:hypothetical protein